MVPTAKISSSRRRHCCRASSTTSSCYRAKRAKGSAKFTKITVNVTDQIESNIPITLTRPYRLCVPVSKNGEDPERADAPEQSALLPVEVGGAVRHGARAHQQPVRRTTISCSSIGASSACRRFC
jgi:hypothetical protein